MVGHLALEGGGRKGYCVDVRSGKRGSEHCGKVDGGSDMWFWRSGNVGVVGEAGAAAGVGMWKCAWGGRGTARAVRRHSEGGEMG